MKHLAQCVVRYAQCLWQAQPLLPPEAVAVAPASSDRLRHAAQLADRYLAGLLASLAALPANQRATLTQAARMGLRPVLASQRKPDAVRDALIAGELLVPPHAPVTSVAPWRDESLAAIALRSLQYALDLTEALPDPHTASPMTGLSGDQHAALWSAAHLLEEQQATLWDTVEAITADEAATLADAARIAVTHVDPDGPHAELLAYFASGMFAERVQAKG
jgi:hypothetical protein